MGPVQDPSGTQEVTFVNLEKLSPTLTRCLRLIKKLENQLNMLPDIP